MHHLLPSESAEDTTSVYCFVTSDNSIIVSKARIQNSSKSILSNPLYLKIYHGEESEDVYKFMPRHFRMLDPEKKIVLRHDDLVYYGHACEEVRKHYLKECEPPPEKVLPPEIPPESVVSSDGTEGHI